MDVNFFRVRVFFVRGVKVGKRALFLYAACLFLGLAVVVAPTGRARASDSLNSELSHAAGGAAMAGAVTYFADHYRPRYRGWIGFATSVGIGIILEGVDLANGDGFSVLDAGSNLLGAAAGAFVTDRFILRSVVEPTGEQGAYLGVRSELLF